MAIPKNKSGKTWKKRLDGPTMLGRQLIKLLEPYKDHRVAFAVTRNDLRPVRGVHAEKRGRMNLCMILSDSSVSYCRECGKRTYRRDHLKTGGLCVKCFKKSQEPPLPLLKLYREGYDGLVGFMVREHVDPEAFAHRVNVETTFLVMAENVKQDYWKHLPAMSKKAMVSSYLIRGKKGTPATSPVTYWILPEHRSDDAEFPNRAGITRQSPPHYSRSDPS